MTLAAKVLNDTTVSPGWLGFGVFLLLALATFLLVLSFRKQLRKVAANERARAEAAGEQPELPVRRRR